MKILKAILALVLTFTQVCNALQVDPGGTYSQPVALMYYYQNHEQCREYQGDRELFLDCLKFSAELARDDAIKTYANRLQKQLTEEI
ncbi:hypothetical protein AHIS2_p009 [Acaryochloris phage A-HIS2]|nr:hypothetical protein AHIS2_p009 [Acaryochloris phage A-HIS2]